MVTRSCSRGFVSGVLAGCSSRERYAGSSGGAVRMPEGGVGSHGRTTPRCNVDKKHDRLSSPLRDERWPWTSNRLRGSEGQRAGALRWKLVVGSRSGVLGEGC